MKRRYLVVTFRDGRALAGYLYLPRNERAKARRTTDEGRGMRADFDAEDVPTGIEITRPAEVSTDDMNAVLERLGQPALVGEELAPLRAA